jgi:sulfite exporter TauE/SafE
MSVSGRDRGQETVLKGLARTSPSTEGRVILAFGLTTLPGVLPVALSLQHVLCTG